MNEESSLADAKQKGGGYLSLCMAIFCHFLVSSLILFSLICDRSIKMRPRGVEILRLEP